MAQPTVNSRPSTWSGTSGPILYNFTSTNSGNAGYYMAVEVWNSTTATKVADAKFYANSSSVVIVNVASFLKDNMSLLNTSDLTSGVLDIDTNWIKYYIKYRELWTASSETQVDDVGNLRYAVYGGLQIGSANNLTAYVTATYKFLTLMDECTAVTGYPFTISAYMDGGSSVRVVRSLDGSTLDTTDTADSTLGVYRILHHEVGTADKAVISIITGTVSEAKTVNIIEACDNTIVLQWRNSLGGDECFPFMINQEYEFQYGDRKAKRLTLFAENLTLNQWEVIQGLNTNGDFYKTPITEMTTSLNRTMSKVGQAVYVYNSDGTKIGVTVINQSNTTNTKQKTHSASITIEYPELFLQ